MKTLAIIGAGDLGRQIANYALEDGHYQKVVFIDDYSNESYKYNIPIIGNSNDIEKLYKKGAFDELIIGIGYKHLQKKKELYIRFKGAIPFGKIVHSTSWIAPSAKVLSGTVIYPNCSVDIDAVIEENTILNNGCTIAHDSIIQKHSFLAPRVAIAGFVKVEEQCILGINSTIIDNIFVKERTQIGAGTVVIKNIDKSGLYVGNPHRLVR
ncbi:Sugar O-acyltransferase (Sialic acid O-acetyltransferase NeuD family) [Tenacibaculum sp. 190130A14a]|uniref:Sugar O-acyltransferase (Sialic acid O-acetyltransferase NeuD family) n=1 Tax=Tenacibaculum polynesiense TaxID=3137857 RepID=A0ABM9PCT9_9FLAO